ncbi:MAG: DEAD/DEAH box helicase family protein [Eubacteriales bacterium]|nr:DEAD/DEAH box helicase family protein [Eubacteriales bacterium]
MDKHAIIHSIEYTLLEVLPSLDGEQTVICEDMHGNRYACPASLWVSHTPQPATAVHQRCSSKEKIALFRSLFRGREDVYAKRWHNVKSGKSGYSPACQNEWERGLCDKKNVSCAQCDNRLLKPLTDEVLFRHLAGQDEYARDVVGLFPMLQDETTYILAADFDDDGWQSDVAAFCDVCREFDLTPAVERSRSGEGGHVWFFFEAPVPAADVRRLGSGLLTRAMKRRASIKLKSYDRLFPNQDTLPKGGFGNLIALPLQGQARRNGNSLFVDENFQPYPDQWAYLCKAPKISRVHLDELLKAVCPRGELGDLVEAEAGGPKPWHRHKPEDISPMELQVSVNVTLADGIYIEKAGLSQPVLNKLRRLAAFRNPDFYKAQAMRLPTYNKPRVIDTSENLDKYLKLPRGCFENVTQLLPNCSVTDERVPGKQIAVQFQGSLRDEQIPAAEALLTHETGVLSATTAFGKTVIGAYLIGSRKVNTLILVHASALLAQWKSALEQFLVIEEKLPPLPPKRGRKKQRPLIGQLGAGKNTVSGIVDIAIMQSLMDGDGVKELVKNYGMVICDECHHVPAVSFERVLSSVQAKYVYGLTATPLRADGHQPIIFLQCGPIRYRVDAKKQAEKRAFSHYIIPRFTSLRIADENLKIQGIYGEIAKNKSRNSLIIQDIQAALAEGRAPLVLTERKSHAEILAALLGESCPNVLLLTGSGGQKAKREKLEQLHSIPDSEPLVVVATGKYIGEGFDEPRLDTLFLAMPISWKGTLAQYVGRLHRSFDDKQEVRVYDYVDIHVAVLERMHRKRLKGYAELGYQVKPSATAESPAILYDGSQYYAAFQKDVSQVQSEIVIASPRLQANYVKSLLNALPPSVTLTIMTQPSQENISELLDKNVQIEEIHGLRYNFAVIDRKLTWYGDTPFLSFTRAESTALRLESPDVAGELLEILGK